MSTIEKYNVAKQKSRSLGANRQFFHENSIARSKKSTPSKCDSPTASQNHKLKRKYLSNWRQKSGRETCVSTRRNTLAQSKKCWTTKISQQTKYVSRNRCRWNSSSKISSKTTRRLSKSKLKRNWSWWAIQLRTRRSQSIEMRSGFSWTVSPNKAATLMNSPSSASATAPTRSRSIESCSKTMRTHPSTTQLNYRSGGSWCSEIDIFTVILQSYNIS